MSMRTESEEKFEQYLTGQNLTWNRIPESNRKEPDYTVRHGGSNCIFEVKEFDEPETKPVGGYSPLPPIRDRINRAREKFTEYRKYCCGVVLWGSKSIYRTAHQSVVFPAAFGEGVNTEPEDFVDAGAEPQSFRFVGKAALTPKQNTSVSAIAILAEYRLNHVWVEAGCQMMAKRQRVEEIKPGEQFELCQRIYDEKGLRYSYEGTIRMIVLENPYARTPFPPDLFVGPFDQHWRLQAGRFRLAFMGSELERLKNENVPSVFW
jgi:hypothetical protein